MTEENTGPQRLTDRFNEQIVLALNKYGAADNFLWETGVGPHPQTGQPSVVLFVWLKTALIGQEVFLMSYNSHRMTNEEIDSLVQQMVQQGREQRSLMLAKASAPHDNGHLPKGKLIIPGVND